MPSQKTRSCCSNSCGKIPGWTSTKHESDNSSQGQQHNKFLLVSLWNELHKITQHVACAMPNENNNNNNDFLCKFTLLPSANDDNNHNKITDDSDEKMDSSSSSLIFNRHHHLCVGQGAWSKVYAGFCNKTFQSVAFKVIPKSKIDNEAICRDVIREVRILRRLRKIAKSVYGYDADVDENENEVDDADNSRSYRAKLLHEKNLPTNSSFSTNKVLLPFPLLLGAFHTETEIILVMTRAPGKTLFEFLTERETSLKNNSNSNIINTEDEDQNENTKRIVRSLLQAVHTLHRGCRTGHRDVKLENILIATPQDVRNLVAQEKEFQQLYFSSLSQEHDQRQQQRQQRVQAVLAKKGSSSSGSESDDANDQDAKNSESASKRNENKKKPCQSQKKNGVVIANESSEVDVDKNDDDDDNDDEKKRNFSDLDSDFDDDADKSNLGVPKFFGSIFDKESMSLKSVSFFRALNSRTNKTQNNIMQDEKPPSSSSQHMLMRKINSNNIHVTLVDFGFAHSLPLPTIFTSSSESSPPSTSEVTSPSTTTTNTKKNNAISAQNASQKQFVLTSHLSCASLDSADMSCCGENSSSSSSCSSVSSSRSVSCPLTPVSESKSEKPNNNSNNKKNNSSPTVVANNSSSDSKGGPKFPSAAEDKTTVTTSSKKNKEKSERRNQRREANNMTISRKPSSSSSPSSSTPSFLQFQQQQSLYFSLRFAPLEILLQLLPNYNNHNSNVDNNAMNRETDDKSMKQDIFGVGVCAYLLLTGKWPYSGKTPAQLSFQMKSGSSSLKFMNCVSSTTSSQLETAIQNHNNNSSQKNKSNGHQGDSGAIAASASGSDNNNTNNNINSLSAARKCVVNLLHSDSSKRWRTDEALECEWIC